MPLVVLAVETLEGSAISATLDVDLDGVEAAEPGRWHRRTIEITSHIGARLTTAAARHLPAQGTHRGSWGNEEQLTLGEHALVSDYFATEVNAALR
ncbi:MAG: hypothetical protein R2697_05530 [Ilumatobacteraceae bacterium]